MKSKATFERTKQWLSVVTMMFVGLTIIKGEIILPPIQVWALSSFIALGDLLEVVIKE